MRAEGRGPRDEGSTVGSRWLRRGSNVAWVQCRPGLPAWRPSGPGARRWAGRAAFELQRDVAPVRSLQSGLRSLARPLNRRPSFCEVDSCNERVSGFRVARETVWGKWQFWFPLRRTTFVRCLSLGFYSCVGVPDTFKSRRSPGRL